MKRKILCAVLAVLVALPCCLMFNACGGGVQVGWSQKNLPNWNYLISKI